MTGKLIRILVCVALGLMTTPALADDSPFGTEYRWLTSLDVLGASAQVAVPDHSYPNTIFMRLMMKPFIKVNSAQGLRQSELAAGYFRRADPEFGIPQAFRRQQQMRLGFRIHF